jgi:hypothetical protein
MLGFFNVGRGPTPDKPLVTLSVPIVNVGVGPTPEKPSSITLAVPHPDKQLSSFLNIRVADIQACHELW